MGWIRDDRLIGDKQWYLAVVNMRTAQATTEVKATVDGAL